MWQKVSYVFISFSFAYILLFLKQIDYFMYISFQTTASLRIKPYNMTDFTNKKLTNNTQKENISRADK